MKPTISLIVVGYQSDAVWEQFFSSLRRSTSIPEKIVVIENSQTEPRIEDAPDLNISVFQLPANPGYGTAANYGYSRLKSQTDLVLICNPDLVFEADTIALLSSEITAVPNAGIVGPQILNPDGTNYPTGRGFPRLGTGLGHALLGTIWSQNPWTQKYLGTREGPEARTVDWVSGACMMIRGEVFESISGFDQDYFMFVEDVDLCLRAQRKGWESRLVPGAKVLHRGGHSTQFRRAEMIRAHHESMRRFLNQHYNRPRDLIFRTSLGIGLKFRAELLAWLEKKRNKS